MTSPSVEYKALARLVARFESHFLSRHLASPSLAAPTDAELLDVAGYVVLSHGALENFVEGLALWVVDRVVTGWTARNRVSRCTATMLLHHGSASAERLHRLTPFDYVREALDEVKSTVSDAINLNNGVTERHLRELLGSAGIEVPRDAILSNSLDLVIKMRHQWAHQYRYGARVVRSASDARNAVNDCLELAKRLAAAASAARP